MKKQNTVFIVISILILIVIVISFTYAFFSANITSIGNLNVTANIGEAMTPIFTAVPSNDLILNITDADMLESESNNNTTTLTANETMNVTLIAGSLGEQVTCTFDFVWTRLPESDTYVPSSGRGSLKENTISIIDDNSNVVLAETNIDSFTSGNAIASGSITSHGMLSTKVYTITQSFYNLNINQTMYNASYKSRISVQNISCDTSGTYEYNLVDFIKNDAPRSGTDAVSNSPWILTSDHEGELRYAGKNPDNYIEFNGELWRIIGVMPNMTYCTGTYGDTDECNTTATGSLVKIIRNDSLGDFIWDYKQTGVGSSITTTGSNDWSDSQLMLMLNGTNYLKTGYDVNNTKLHNSYTITSNIVAGNGYNFYNATYSYLDGNGTTMYKPSSATTSSYTATSGTVPKKITSSELSKIATVKWDLYGTNNYDTAAEGNPSAFYNKERNINGLGAVYTGTTPENRPAYWYGKIGLMYPSDYGYATNGGSTYDRDTCLGKEMVNWNNGSYKTDCALNSYLLFSNITSSAPGTSNTYQWILSPNSGYAYVAFVVSEYGYVGVSGGVHQSRGVRPVLYLKADTTITGGTGTFNNPYTIGSPEPKTYWFAASTYNNSTFKYEPTYTYPSYGGTLQNSGLLTGYNTFIGQDSTKHYACGTERGHEICLSQPYTQYGITGHVAGTDFTNSEQSNLKQYITQIFVENELDVDPNSQNTMGCSSTNLSVYCFTASGNLSIIIDKSGEMIIRNTNPLYGCGIYYDGTAYCYVYNS